MSFLETGRALYLLAAICLGGIMVRLAAGSFYKRLIRESSNLALAKNRYLRALRQNAEDTYRINMGMNNTRVYLERQIYSLRFMGRRRSFPIGTEAIITTLSCTALWVSLEEWSPCLWITV